MKNMMKSVIIAAALILSAASVTAQQTSQRFFTSEHYWNVVGLEGSKAILSARHQFSFRPDEVYIVGPNINRVFRVKKIVERPDATEYTVYLPNNETGLVVARLDENNNIIGVTMYLLGWFARQCNR